jgi:tetratricopeptide (TPR) repeat protein
MSALKSDGARAQTLLAGLQKAVPFANLLWRVGLADRPYRLAPQLRAWVEAHPLDRAARTLLTLLPQTPQEPFPPRDKPVQLFKKLPPLSPAPVIAAPRLVMPKHSGNLLRDAILASRIGNRDQALVLLLQAVMQEPHNEEAWLWLARLMETEAQVIECLRHIVEINPDNKLAQEELQRLTGDQGNVQTSKVQQSFEA